MALINIYNLIVRDVNRLYGDVNPPYGQVGTDTSEEVLEQLTRNGNLCHLEDCPSGVADDLRTYLYEFELDAPK